MEENSTWIVASALGIWAFDNGPTDLSKAKQRNSNSPQPKAKAKQQGGPNDLWISTVSGVTIKRNNINMLAHRFSVAPMMEWMD